MRLVLPWDAIRTRPPPLGAFGDLLKTDAWDQDNSSAEKWRQNPHTSVPSCEELVINDRIITLRRGLFVYVIVAGRRLPGYPPAG